MKLRDNIKKILIVIATLIFLGLLIYFAGPVVIRAAIYVFRLFSPFIFCSGSTTINLLPTRLDVFRVATTLPTILPTIIFFSPANGFAAGLIAKNAPAP